MGKNDMHSQLMAANRKISEHPGYLEYLELQALSRSIAAIFLRNRDELTRLLQAAATDWPLAFELTQNVREPVVREQFQEILTQRLHNNLAGVFRLVEHVRRIMRGRAGPTAEEFDRRKKTILQQPEVPFVDDLRDYVTHRRLPVIAHSLSWTNVNQPNQQIESEVELNVADLLEWKGWSPVVNEYLTSLRDAVPLRSIIGKQSALVLDLNGWLIHEL